VRIHSHAARLPTERPNEFGPTKIAKAMPSNATNVRFPGVGGMNDDLLSKTCTPCRGGVPPLTRAEAEGYLEQASGWALVDEGRRIERSFTFKNFKEALDFVARIGNLAEKEGHHPDIGFGWGSARISWQTKKIKGLHENDFIMAAKTNELSGA
jgi:4a-hydroxytetrahydrobiopterin dehydratase